MAAACSPVTRPAIDVQELQRLQSGVATALPLLNAAIAERQRADAERREQELQKREQELDERQQCIICFERPRAVVFVPCGHLVSCEACVSLVQGTDANCPSCRQHITSQVRAFMD